MIEHFLNKGYNSNRWLIRYFKFINFCKLTNYRDEVHHILPRALFPEYSNLNENVWNSIQLSYRQHLISHYILAKAVGGNMWYCISLMNKHATLNSRLYEESKINSSLNRQSMMTVWDIDNKINIYININEYDPFYHLTSTRKFSPMKDEYLKILYITEFNEKYNTNFLICDFNDDYKQVLHKIRTSINQKRNNSIHSPGAIERQKVSLTKYYKNNSGNNKGKKASEETKAKQRESAKNRVEPSRKKKFILISPNGEKYLCNGNLKSKVIELQLSLNTLKTRLNEVIPEELRNHYNTILRANTTGWLLKEVTNF